MSLEDHLKHFPNELSPEIKKYADDHVFKNKSYIFTRRQGKQQYGYCTHCRTEFKTEGLRHKSNRIKKTTIPQYTFGDDHTCPNCQSIGAVKSSGMKRGCLIDKAYFVYYQKSVINPNAIIATGIFAVRDYTKNYHDVETQYLVEAWYLFEMGNSAMASRRAYYYNDGRIEGYCRGKNKSIFSLYSRHEVSYFGLHTGTITCCSTESIKEAVKDTPFQYSTWSNYHHYGDMVKFFDLYTKYPCIEYLTKLGLGSVVEDKLIGRSNYSAVHWRGKTLPKVLRLGKKEINEIRASDISIDSLLLKLLQISKKDGSNLSIAEIEQAQQYAFDFDDLQKVLKHTTIKKIHSFITKQYTKYNHDKRYREIRQVLTTWKDYINDCPKLQLDLSVENILFPPDLHKAHQNTIKQIKIKANKVFDKKIRKRAKALKKYYFKDFDLLIRPVNSCIELIEEGTTLNHCVGGYAERYAEGKIDILVIRKTSEPDKPYYTVEINKGEVRQCRGNKNCSPSDDVTRFMESFKEQKLSKKRISA